MPKQFERNIVKSEITEINLLHRGVKIDFSDGYYTFLYQNNSVQEARRTDGKVDIEGETYGVGDKVYITKYYKKTVFGFLKGEGNYTDILISGVTVRVFNTVKWQAEVAERYCNFPNDICNAVIFHPLVAPEPKSGSRGDIVRNTLNRLHHGDIPGVRYYIQTSEDVFLERLSLAMMKNDITILNGLPHTQIQG